MKHLMIHRHFRWQVRMNFFYSCLTSLMLRWYGLQSFLRLHCRSLPKTHCGLQRMRVLQRTPTGGLPMLTDGSLRLMSGLRYRPSCGLKLKSGILNRPRSLQPRRQKRG